LPLSWEEILVICAALALGGLMKGITGVGLPLITVPVMAGFLGVERAVVTMVIPSAVLNLYQVWTHRQEYPSVPEVPRLLVMGAVGAVFGATLLHLASERALATGLAAWLVAYIILRALHPAFSLSLAARMRWSPLVGLGSGALQAATGISAPLVAAYVDSLRLAPRAYVFAVCAPFAAFATAHFTILLGIGTYTPDLLWQSLLAIVPALAFIPVGVWMRQFITQRRFELIIRLTLLAMAVRLLYGAWQP
jgi:uncharacterized membrane protein YfcA